MKRLEPTRMAAELNTLFGRLGNDAHENIRAIVTTAGKLLGGVCALYSKLDAQSQSLCTWAAHNAPADVPSCSEASGRICFEATIKGGNRPVVISEIGSSAFAETDDVVRKLGLKAYLGYPVQRENERLGSLCVVDAQTRFWNDDEIELIASLAKALSLEEERIASMQQLLDGNALMDQAQRLAGVGGWDYDLTTKKLTWTEETFRIHDLPPGLSPSAREAQRFIAPQDRSDFFGSLKRARQEGRAFEQELRIITHRGETRWVRITAKPLVETGRVNRIVGSVQNITQQKKTLRALAAERDAAKKAQQVSLAFMTQTGRALADPLIAMLARLERINPMELGARERIQLESALQTGEGLLTDLQAMSSLGIDTPGSAHVVNLHALLENIMDSFAARAEDKGIGLQLRVDSRTPHQIRADRFRLRTILSILMDNAVTFTKRGGVRLDTAPVSRGNGAIRLLFSISDTGSGIPDERINALFEPIHPDVRQIPGTVREGLALARVLAEEMRGNISVDSEVDIGTTIHVALPFKLDEGRE